METGIEIFLGIFFIVIVIAWVFGRYKKKSKKTEKQSSNEKDNFFNSTFSNFYNKTINQGFSASDEISYFVNNEIVRICQIGDSFTNSLNDLETSNYEKYQKAILKILKSFELDFVIFEIFFSACCNFNATSLDERAWYAISTVLDKKKEFGYVKLEMLKIEIAIGDKLFYILYLLSNDEEEFNLIFADTNYSLIQRLKVFLKNKIIYKNINNLDDENLLNKEFIQKEKNIYKSNMKSYFDYFNKTSYTHQKTNNNYEYEDEFDFDSFSFDEDDWDEFLNKKQKNYKSKTNKDYHAILGVSKNATEQEIKIAFRKKAKEWHPDVCKKANAESMFKDINEAYNNLINEKK